MAGYREFQTGEVLTAANVNSFLMEQATMTFADAAARDAALAGVLREGLLTYNLDEGRLEVYDGTDWVEPAPEPPEPPAGIGSNVVQTIKTDTFSTTSATFVEVTGLTATITPTSDTSKILVLANYQLGQSDQNRGAHSRLMRASTAIYLGGAEGSRVVGSANFTTSDSGVVDTSTVTLTALDSPNTDAPVTYSIEILRGSTGTAFIGRSGFDANNTNFGRVPASITLIEVAA